MQTDADVLTEPLTVLTARTGVTICAPVTALKIIGDPVTGVHRNS